MASPFFVSAPFPLSFRTLGAVKTCSKNSSNRKILISSGANGGKGSKSTGSHNNGNKKGGSNGNGGGAAKYLGNNNIDDGTILFGRFREFTSSSGNAHSQDELVREVLWQATRLSTSESMESTIQTQLDATSEILSDMYSKSERDIEERNHRIALQTSLPNISKWNQQLMAGNKTSKQHQVEISKELELVDALLKRTARQQRRRRRRLHRKRDSSTNTDGKKGLSSLLMQHEEAAGDDVIITPSDLNSSTVENIIGPSTVASTPSGVLFTALVCTVALESFETIASREGGPARLANYAAFSAVLILSVAYISALRSALQRAQEDLQKQAGPFHRRKTRGPF